MYSGAIRRAGEALKSCNVQRRHIILISDGQPGENYEDYASAIRANFKSLSEFPTVPKKIKKWKTLQKRAVVDITE